MPAHAERGHGPGRLPGTAVTRVLLIVAALTLAGWSAWQASVGWSARGFSSANAKETRAVAPTNGPLQIIAEGRMETYPGARIVISSELTGVLTNILVQEKSRVAAGELLAELRADDVYASSMEARARAAEVEAEMALAQLELDRGRALAKTGVNTPQDLDRLEKGMEALLARRTTAQVLVRRLEITSAKTRITAPFAGVVLERYIHAGEVVVGGTPIVTLADLRQVRVVAELDEFDAGRVRLGATVSVRAEGFETTCPGEVEEIPDFVSPRSLHPQDPAQPSDVRVLRVKVALKDAAKCPFKLGQRVELSIASE